jgi:hypothetical protein
LRVGHFNQEQHTAKEGFEVWTSPRLRSRLKSLQTPLKESLIAPS